MELKVFVVVVTYNGWQWYERCFSSLVGSTFPVQTIVVDNASNDGTLDYVRNNYSDFVLIGLDKNLGFGQANNLGLRYAIEHGCDYVFLLNQDAWIEPDTVSQLIKVSMSHTEYGILSPIHLNVEKTAVEKLLLKRLVDHHTTDSRLFEDMLFHRLNDVYDTKYVNAAAWFLPRKTIETIGGFDPVFFHYGEDDNYINRVQYHNMKIGICPNITIVHDNDRPRPLYDNREQEVLNFIFFTNINNNISIEKELLIHFRKMITSILLFRKKAFLQHRVTYIFLKSNKSKLEQSRTQNKVKGYNWIS